MKQTMEAIYENGMLRPLRKIEATEGQTVRVTVETADDDFERVASLPVSKV